MNAWLPLALLAMSPASDALPCATHELRLGGIIHSATFRIALLQGPDRTEQAMEGTLLCEMFRVTAIHPGRVHLLSRDGTAFTLALAADDANAARRLPPVMPARAAHEWVQDELLPAGLVRDADFAYTVNKTLRDALLAPERLLADARFVKDSGGGYFVAGLRRGSLAEAAGLHVGDRILRVNGRELGNPMLDAALFGALRRSDEVRVEVARMEGVIELRYRVVEH